MAIRKIDLMHKLFGKANGKCKDCSNFMAYYHHYKPYKKCTVYGVTHSTATDWNCGYEACGLFNQITNRHDIVRMVQPTRKDGAHERAQIEIDFGQLTLNDISEGGNYELV